MVFNRLIPVGADFYPFKIEQACRFNDDDSAYLTWTPSTDGSDNQWIFSFWVKRANLGITDLNIIDARADTNNWLKIFFDGSDRLEVRHESGGAAEMRYTTSARFRDITNWYHILVSYDSDQATQSDRFALYVNGVQVTAFENSNEAGTGTTNIFQNVIHTIGGQNGGATNAFDGYLAELIAINGYAIQAGDYAITDFGEFKNGVWIPKQYSGSYGTNGFYLDFANSADLGNDVSGNNNDFTSSGLDSDDQVLDTPTNNFCVWNLLDTDITSLTATFADGNLEYRSRGTDYQLTRGTLAAKSGKYYAEVIRPADSDNWTFGVKRTEDNIKTGQYLGQTAGEVSYHKGGSIYVGGSATQTGLTGLSQGDVLGCALNLDDNEVTFYINGTQEGTAESIDSDTEYSFAISDATISQAVTPLVTDFGQLGFSYTPPTGFVAMSVENLPEPTFLEPDKYFDAVAYDGDDVSPRDLAGFNFQADLVVIKNRDATTGFFVYDSIRGTGDGAELETNESNAEGAANTEAYGKLSAFNSDGFEMVEGTTDFRYVNDLSYTYVAWLWKKLAAAGIDIVSFQGTGAAHAENHNLNGVPELMIGKNRSVSGSWPVYHFHALNKTDPETDAAYLDLANAFADTAENWNDTAPTSTQLTVGSHARINGSGNDIIVYLFRSIPGFSKVFSYEGYANADGPFVNCGFRPKFVLFKSADASGSFMIKDTVRDTYNDNTVAELYPDTDAAEADGGNDIDIVSNGFKVKSAQNRTNPSGTVVGIAFAALPGKYANAF